MGKMICFLIIKGLIYKGIKKYLTPEFSLISLDFTF